jgi:hypothetical protein
VHLALHYIYNHSLFTGIIPDRLDIAVVKPLYKKRGKTSMTNYRSVSLLTVLSKVLKKAMHGRLSQHLHKKNILITELCGFRKGISTEDAAFRLTDSVFKPINHKMHVGGIFCDLAEAFNCMNHESLLTKLHSYGIKGIFID